MSYALVASVSAGSANGGDVTTGDINTTGADLIVITSHYYSRFGPNNTPTDNKSNTYTLVVTHDRPPAGNQQGIAVFYCVNPTVGSGHHFIVTDSGNGNQPAVCAFAFSGGSATTVDTFSASDASSFPSNTFSGGAITPSVNNCLVIITDTNTNSTTNGTTSNVGTLGETVAWTASFNYGGVTYYDIQTSAATDTVTWSQSWTTGDENAFALVAFNPGTATNTDTTWMVRQQRPMANFFPTIVKVP